MFTVMVVFHTLICIGLIIVVLLQSSKGEGLAGSAFGGGGGGGGISNAVFGGRGAATFLSKATTVLAVVFFLNCIALAYMSAGTRAGFTGAGTTATPESVITQKAQQERDRALQQQQQQQMNADSLPVQILDESVTPADTSGQ